MPRPFVFPVRVEFDECDLYGIVHHARYFIYMERARVQMFREMGMPPDSLHGHGFGLVLVEDHTRYRRPTRFGESLSVEVVLGKLGAASLSLQYQIFRGEDPVVESTIRLACVGPDGRPSLFPSLFQQALHSWEIP